MLLFNAFNTVAAFTLFIVFDHLFGGDTAAARIWPTLFGSIGGMFTLMMSMTADACDLDELATGKRREAIVGAIYWWMVTLGFAIAGLLSAAIMSAVGFTPGAAAQAAGAVDGLRLFSSGRPILGTLLAMWMMHGDDLNELARRSVAAAAAAAV